MKYLFSFFTLQLLLIALCPKIGYGQLNVRFNHLTSNQGLTSNSTKCLLKDSRGFLWIGTDSGLNRFDGKNIITYTHTIGDSTSIINNDIFTLFEDHLHRIWIGTNGGLSILDPETSLFTNFTKLESKGNKINFTQGIKGICALKNKVFITGLHDLIMTSTDSFSFELITDKLKYPKNINVTFLPDGALSTNTAAWFLTFKGLLYTEDGITFYHKFNHPDDWPIFDKGWFSNLENNGDTAIFLTSFSFPGIYVYSPVTHRLDSLPFPENTGTNNISIMSLCKVDKDEYWGTSISNGVFRFNSKSRSLNLLTPDKTDPGSLSSLECVTILVDDQQTIFIATNRGLDYLNPLQPPFKVVNVQNNKITNMDISTAEDDKGILWIAPLYQGIFSLDQTTGNTEYFQFPGEYNNVWTTFVKDDYILLSTGGGLAIFSTTTKKLKPIDDQIPESLKDLLTGRSAFIYKDSSESIWIGLFNNGLLKYNLLTKELIHFSARDSIHPLPGNGSISALYTDHSDTFWVSYNSTYFSMINTLDNSVTNYQLPKVEDYEMIDVITSILKDHNGHLWIGTKQTGLFKYDIVKDEFTNYDKRKGLSSNIIGSILFDQQNNLWVNTSNGLNKFDPITKSFTVFTMADGLPSNQFNQTTSHLSHDGTIYTGNDLFLVSFNPKDIKLNPNLPKLIFPSYTKSGEHIMIKQKDKQLNFSWRDKISFEFLSINYIDPAKTEYAYFLEGYDDDWNYSGNSSSANYANLPGGTYTLRIKTTNRAGFWEVPETIMLIHVFGPFWLSWWFFPLCICFCVGIIYYIYHYRLAQFKIIQDIRNKISQDLHDDIGSTLSSISISSIVAQKMAPDQYPEIISTLDYIGNSTRSAMENMSDIVWAINPSNDSFKKLIERLQIYAIKMLNAKDISLQMDIPETLYETKLSMQQRKNIYLILRESIQNVAKYSDATTCTIVGKIVDKKINLQVKDDGQGFDKALDNLGGNGLINMKERAKELNAVFTILSEKLNGTTLTLQLK